MIVQNSYIYIQGVWGPISPSNDPPNKSANCNCQSHVYRPPRRKMPMNYKITPQKFAVAVIQNVTLTPTPPQKQELNGLCHISRHFHEAQMSYLLSVLSQFQLLCTQFVQNACSQHSTQIGYIHYAKTLINMSGNTLMYPICVECLHIPMCKLSTQIGYIFD